MPLARQIGRIATATLLLELDTWPKPGLVSLVDAGSHADMDAAMLRASAEVLQPAFVSLAQAGAAGAGLDDLREIGLAADRSMLRATGGVNTHRGAIFGLGLLCAAAGALLTSRGHTLPSGSLGMFVRQRWGGAIRAQMPGPTHGGARAEAAAGFPHVYRAGLPALRAGRLLAPGDDHAARVQACMALLAELEDTNLLHRGGPAGLQFARRAGRDFLARGGVGQNDWQARAVDIHREFVARWLSPGGSADLLAATLLVDRLEGRASSCSICSPFKLATPPEESRARRSAPLQFATP